MMARRITTILLACTALALLIPKTIGCDGGSGCDPSGCDPASMGCESSCGGTVSCEPIPGGFPEEAKDKSGHSAQVRLTEHGFAFVQDDFAAIIASFLPDGLEFEVPETSGEASGQCYEICTFDKHLCTVTINIDNVRIVPTAPNHLRVEIDLVGLHLELPTRLEAFCQSWLGTNCHIFVDADTFPAAVDVDLNIDPVTKGLSLDIGEPEFNLDAVNISTDCDGIMGFLIDLIFPLLEGTLKGMAGDMLADPINDAIASFTCLACETVDDCPAGTGATCEDGQCMVGGQCLPMPLGMEGATDMGAMLSDLAPGLRAPLWYWFFAGGYAEVAQGGVNLGMMTGLKAPERSIYAPPADPPNNPPAQRIPFGNDLDGEPYMVGIGISEEFLDNAMFALYESGVMNLSIGSDLSDMISSDLFGLLLPSLGTLTRGANAPMLLSLNPRAPADIILGSGAYFECPDCPEGTECDPGGSGFCLDGDAAKVLEEPLINIAFDDLAIDFYAQVDDRYTRLFRVQFDMVVGVNLEFTPDNMLLPVIGEIAMDDVQASEGEILAEDPESLAALLPQLIDLALPMLLENLDPIEIPPIEGFKIKIDKLRAELEIDDPDNPGEKKWTAFALYAGLDLVETPLPPPADTTAEIVQLDVPRYPVLRRAVREIEAPTLVIRAGGTLPDLHADGRLEYSYRLDRGVWTPFTPSPTFTVHSPSLLLQGRHKLWVRARVLGDYQTLDPTPARIEFVIDALPPEILDVVRTDQAFELQVRDGVATDAEVTVRHRVRPADGEWSEWRTGRSLALEGLAPLVDLEVEATDGSSNTASRTFRLRTANPEPESGCAATGGSSTAGLLLLLPLGLLLRRRVRPAMLIALIAGLVLVSAGCGDTKKDRQSGDTDVDTDVDTDSDTDTDCGELDAACDDNAPCCEGYACLQGKCYKGCTTDEDCPEHYKCINRICMAPDCITDDDCEPEEYCDEGECKFRRCTEDSDCTDPESPLHLACPDPKYPAVCDTGTGQCVCSQPCNGACPDGKYCCRVTDECLDLPDACADVTCRPGYILDVLSEGQINEETCELDGEECACTALPPLTAGFTGRYADLAMNSTNAVVVSAYNETYGDLMLGTGPPKTIVWTTVDGVPAAGDEFENIVADPAGPRRGIEEPGDDVGQYTSLALDGSGGIHLAYYDATNGDLKYASYAEPCGGCGDNQVCISGACTDLTDDCPLPGCYPFEACVAGACLEADSGWAIHTVDADGDVGRYASLALDPGGVPSIAYFAAHTPSHTAGPRLALASSTAPAAPADWTVLTIEEVPVLPVCGQDEVLLRDGTCVVPTDDCDPACDPAQDACVATVCQRLMEVSSLHDLPHGVGLFTDLAIRSTGDPVVVYYARDEYDAAENEFIEVGNLISAAYDGATFQFTLLDGENAAGEDTGDMGRFCSLLLDGADGMHVTYIDAKLNNLHYLDVTAATATLVDDGFRFDAGGALLAADRINGESSAVFYADSTLGVAYGNASSHELLYASRAAAGGDFNLELLREPAWDPAAPELFQGAWGFYVRQAIGTEDTPLVGSYVYNLKTDPYSSGYIIVPR